MGEESCFDYTSIHCGRKVCSSGVQNSRLKWLSCQVSPSSLPLLTNILNIVHSPRMLKAKITIWKLDKKLKWKDVCTAAHMVAFKASDCSVKSSRFRIRHRIVTWKELASYFRRKKITDPIQWVRAQSLDIADLSSDVTLLTPGTSDGESETDSIETEVIYGSQESTPPPSMHPPSEDQDRSILALDTTSFDIRQTIQETMFDSDVFVSTMSPMQRPPTLANTRRLDGVLWHMREYCNAYVGSPLDLKHTEPSVHHETTHGLFGSRVQDGVALLSQGKATLGFESLNGAFGLTAELLRDHHPMAIAQLITVICELIARGMMPLVGKLLGYMKEMSSITLGSDLPITGIFENLLQAEGDVAYLLLNAMRIAIESLSSVSKESRWKQLYLRERFCDCLYHVGDENERVRLRSNLLRAQEKHYGQNARNVLWTLSNVAHDQLLQGDLVEAEAIYQEMLTRSDSHEGFGRAKNRFAALEGLAKVAIARAERDAISERTTGHPQSPRSSQIKLHEARDLLLEAEAVSASWFGVSSHRTLRVRADLAGITARCFEVDA